MTDSEEMQSPIERRVHRALLEGFLATGAMPTHEDLAQASGIEPADLPEHLAALSAADYVGLNSDGRVICLYPFSPSPTSHLVIIGDRRRHAMCSIDALGMAAMLGQAVEIDGACADCGAPIRLGVSPGAVTHAAPAETVVLARRSGDEPACEACCPFTLFACGPVHGAELAARLPETAVVSLEEALRHAEIIFADFLAETLPVSRRRSELVSSLLQT